MSARKPIPDPSSPIVPGVCCNCGNASDEESPCPQRDDGQHCEHWWDGQDDEEANHASKKPMPEIAPCRCGKPNVAGCGWFLVENTQRKLFMVSCKCGFSGPARKTELGAILAWNPRCSDEAAERILLDLETHTAEMAEASRADKSKEWEEACEYFLQWARLRLQLLPKVQSDRQAQKRGGRKA